MTSRRAFFCIDVWYFTGPVQIPASGVATKNPNVDMVIQPVLNGAID